MKHLHFLFVLFFMTISALCMAEDPAPDYGDSIDIEPPGSAMIISGNTLYMTFCGERKIVAAFDVSVPDKPRLLSEFRIGFFPQGIAFEQNTKKLYVVDGRYLSVLNVFNPAKLTLLERYRIDNDCNRGPSDVILQNGKPVLACRAAGVIVLHSKKKLTDKYARSLTENGNGIDVVSRHSVVKNDGNEVRLPIGMPRRVRHFSEFDGLDFVANGFSGLAVISKNDGYVTDTLIRHSTYGACVYDVVPTGNDGRTVLLAAGEIGIVTADISDLKSGIRYTADCAALRWGNVTGFVRGPAPFLYVCDDSFGLRVVDVSDPQNLKLVGGVSLQKK